jgi:hypothetical protein
MQTVNSKVALILNKQEEEMKFQEIKQRFMTESALIDKAENI